jgi:hypothetical protein
MGLASTLFLLRVIRAHERPSLHRFVRSTSRRTPSIGADRSPIANRLVRLISDFRTPLSLLAGALLGRFVYAVNVYGTTTIFPRFEAVAVPVAFGIAAAGVYKRCSQRQYVHALGAKSERRQEAAP